MSDRPKERTVIDPLFDLDSLAEAEVDFDKLPTDISQRIEEVIKRPEQPENSGSSLNSAAGFLKVDCVCSSVSRSYL